MLFRSGVLPAAVMAEPERVEEYTRRFAEMYRFIHTVEIGENELESVREHYLAAADQAAKYMTPEEHELLRKFLLAIPDRHTFVHGDFHMGNVMLQDGELVLIDVGEAGWGHPLLDFAQTQNAYVNLTTVRAFNCRKVLGMELEQAIYVRDHLFPLYFGDIGPEAMARKMTVVEAMHLVRFLLIAFLQGWDHLPSEFDDELARARVEFFPRVDELCALIGSEF